MLDPEQPEEPLAMESEIAPVDDGMVDSSFAEAAITGNLNPIIDLEEEPNELTKWNVTKLTSFVTDRNWFSTIRGISEFAGPSQFNKPSSKSEIFTRYYKNTRYFFTNYIVLLFVILFFTVITQPLLFITTGIIGYGWMWAMKQEALELGPIKLEGKMKMITLGAASACITFLVAGSSILWVVCLTFGLSSVHAIAHQGADALEDVKPIVEDEEDVELEALV